MTILSIARDIAPLIGIAKPEALLSSVAPEHEELVTIAGRAVDYIINASNWQALSTEHTLIGDGVTTEFDFPADFSRFTEDDDGEANIFTPIMVGAMHRIPTMNEWLYREVKQIGRITYSWIVYGGRIRIKPALPVGVPAKFFYQSNNAISDGLISPSFKEAFTSDGDVFRLDSRMLNLCMLWMWRHANGQSYAQYQQEFEKRKAEISRTDKGPRSISFGRTKPVMSAELAYPFELS